MNNAANSSELSRFICAVVRWRHGVVALWAVAVAVSAFAYISNFRIDNSVAIWFLVDDPELDAYRRYHGEFGEREWTYVWLRGDSIFSPEFLRDLRQLHDRIESLDDVTGVFSLMDAGGIRRDVVGFPRFETFLTADSGELPSVDEAASLRTKIRGSPLFDGRLVPRDDDRFTILAVEVAHRIDAIEPYRIRLIDEIREAVSSFPAIRDIGITGTTVVNAELNRAARRDMLVYYALITAFVVIGGGFALRRGRDLLVLFAVVLGTIVPVMGGIAALGIPFNLMTVMLPTLLVTVSVSYLVHFISEFHDATKVVNSRRELSKTPASAASEDDGAPNQADGCAITFAISATFHKLLRPGLWTTLTTAVGFASLTVSPVAPIRQIGFAAAVGIGLAWLNTITIAPALLSFLWRNARERQAGSTRKPRGRRFLHWLARPHRVLALLLGVALAAGASGLVRLEADTNYVEFFRPGNEVRMDYAQLEELGMPASYLTVTVRLPEDVPIANVERHRTLLQFEESLRSLPEVLDVLSLDQFVEQLALGVDGGTAAGRTPLLLRLLLALAASGQLPGSGDFLSRDGSLLRLRAMTGALSTGEIEQVREEVSRIAGRLPEDWEVTITGTNVLWANMDAHVVRTQVLSIGIVAGVLLVLLPLAFRSLALGLLGFAVSFVPILCTLGCMAWLGLPVNIATCILGGVVIGLAVDDTIYFLFRVREGLGMGLAAGEAAQRAIGTTGRAMIKTSLILTGGFLTMAASDFLPSVYFGIFFAFSIFVALLADLILLPCLLRVLIRDQKGVGRSRPK